MNRGQHLQGLSRRLALHFRARHKEDATLATPCSNKYLRCFNNATRRGAGSGLASEKGAWASAVTHGPSRCAHPPPASLRKEPITGDHGYYGAGRWLNYNDTIFELHELMVLHERNVMDYASRQILHRYTVGHWIRAFRCWCMSNRCIDDAHYALINEAALLIAEGELLYHRQFFRTHCLQSDQRRRKANNC